MIISIASGKGGTGKTTIATNLAFSIGSNVQILDCDVEEPNVHLFLNPTIEKREKVFTLVPKIDKEKCTLCKKCVEICRFNAIIGMGKSILTFPELCHSCAGCIEVCPEKAITEGFRELGEIEIGFFNDIGFVHGRIRIGEAMAPHLIRKVREYQVADKLNIIDAPPGTSCPVITAVKNTDFVLMVTEPTPFGLHDLKLAIEAVKILKIPRGLIINRSDIGNDEVREYAKKENIPIFMEIPFDRKLAEIYSKGGLIAAYNSEWKEKFRELYNTVKSYQLLRGD